MGALTWAELPDEQRESNRASVRELRAGLAGWGYRVRPIGRNAHDARAGVTELPAELVEELARAEHDRWVRDARAQGYVFGPERDDDRVPPTHPDLVEWQDLDERDRAKDNIRFATAPDLLARLGYEILAPNDHS
jgi:hypothetical protein